jgi:sarcosine oxidase, subunit delta
MKLMRCPLNGLRGIDEFAYGGEVIEMPEAASCSDAQWTDYVFLRTNRRGEVAEWWCHLPSALWFVALRNTESGEVLKTMTVEQWREREAGARASENTAAHAAGDRA